MANTNKNTSADKRVNETTLETIGDMEHNKNLSESFDSMEELMKNLNQGTEHIGSDEEY